MAEYDKPAARQDKFSILYRGDDATKWDFKPKRKGVATTKRLRAGQVPDWAKDAESSDEEQIVVKDKVAEARMKRLQRQAKREQEDSDDDRGHRKRPKRETEEVEVTRRRPKREVEEVEVTRRRPRREVEEVEVIRREKKEVKDEPRIGGLITLKEGEIRPGNEDDDLDEEEEEERRAKLRQMALDRRRAEEAALDAIKEESDGSKEDSEDEFDSEDLSDDSDDEREQMAKPVFVGRQNRATKREYTQEAMEALQRAKYEEEQAKARERKVETKELLIETMEAEAEAIKNAAVADGNLSEADLPNDDDEEDEAEEYELWKIRELKRLKRDRDAREDRAHEAAEVLRRRNMTDAERRMDQDAADAEKQTIEKGKQAFMQKYFHRGAFFQDEDKEGKRDEIYLRDYNAATEFDKVDKSALPKVMQRRRGEWGMKGQTKHTHLMDVDTTDKTSGWSQNNNKIWQKYYDKRAGVKKSDEFERPSQKKKM